MPYLSEPIRTATSLTEVRWACKYEGVNTLVQRLKAVLASLHKIVDSNSNQLDLAAGVYHKMMSGKFIISLCFLHCVLAVIQGFSKGIQELCIEWVALSGEMLAFKKLLKELDTTEVV